MLPGPVWISHWTTVCFYKDVPLEFTQDESGNDCQKEKGFDGGEVKRYFREGKIKEIADYCETAVVGTYHVWLRYELFRGALSQDAFEASERNLTDFKNNSLSRPFVVSQPLFESIGGLHATHPAFTG